MKIAFATQDKAQGAASGQGPIHFSVQGHDPVEDRGIAPRKVATQIGTQLDHDGLLRPTDSMISAACSCRLKISAVCA
jgi:hypothetical protein